MGCLTPILSQDIAKLGMKTMERKQQVNLFHQLVPYQDQNQVVLEPEIRGLWDQNESWKTETPF